MFKYRFLTGDDFGDIAKALPYKHLQGQVSNVFEWHKTYAHLPNVIHMYSFSDPRMQVLLSTGETFCVPERVYIPSSAEDFDYRCISMEYRLAYFAIMSRSSNGYTREKFTREILKQPSQKLPEWILAYLLASLSDYVYDVSTLLPAYADPELEARLTAYAELNPQFMFLMRQRAISYAGYNRLKYKKTDIYQLITRISKGLSWKLQNSTSVSNLP